MSETTTNLQRRHARQAPLPQCWAEATLSAAVRETRTSAQRRDRAKAARKVARLLERGEL